MDRTTGAEAVTAAQGLHRGRDRRDAAARPRRPDRAARDRLRGQRPGRDPSRSAARARARPRLRPLRRLAARRPGARDRRQDLRAARRPVQRLDRRHPRGRPAVAPPPDHPQLRGRGRGHHDRGGHPVHPRRGRRRRPSSSAATRPRRPQRWTAPPRRPAATAAAIGRAPARARCSCRARSTRPSSTRRSCASSSACCCSCARRSAAGSRAAGGASSAASRSSSPTTATTRSATTCASSTGTSTPGSSSCSSSCSSRRRTSRSRCSSTRRRRWRPGDPAKLLFAKRAAAALGYIGLASEDRVAVSALAGRIARRRAAMRGSGRVFRLLADLSAIEPADGPTDLVAAARHAAAQLHGRGVVVLLSDLLDPAADRVIRELAATGSELIVLHVLSPDELDPALEGDLRLVDAETGDGHRRHRRPRHDRRLQGAPGGLEGGLRRPRRQAPGELRRPVVRHQPRRPDVRRAPPPPGPGLGRCRSRPRSRCSGCCSSRPSSRCTCSSCGATRRSCRRRCCGRRLVADVEANAPWQKLRRSLLLLLQLLLVVILALLAARPFLERPAGLARDIVLVVDTSASMGATDVAPEPARGGQGGGDRGPARPADRRQGQRHRRRPDAPGSWSTRRPTWAASARRSTSIEPTSSRGDLGDALELAGKLAARSGDAQILVATDAALATVPRRRRSTRRITVLPVGRERKNQAIVALAVRTAPSAVTRSVFVSVANLDLERAAAPARGLGRRPAARGPRPPARRRRRGPTSSSTTCPRDVGTLEVRLVGARPGRRRGARTSWPSTTGPGRSSRPTGRGSILVVGEGDPYLETALSLPAQRRAVRRRRRPSTARPPSARTAARGTSSSSRAPCRRRCRGRRSWPSRPPRTSPLGEVDRHAEEPGHRVARAPTSRSCATSTCRRPTSPRPRKLVLPDWARTVIPGPGGAPLLYAGSRAGLPTAVLAFEPRRSDLPLQVAFPILLANLTGELLGGSAAPTEAVAARARRSACRSRPARPALTVTRPDGIDRRARRRRDRRSTRDVRRDRAAGRLHRHAASCAPTRRRPVGERRRVRPRRARAAGRRGRRAPGGARTPRSTRTRRSASPSTCSTSTSRRSRRGRVAAIEALGRRRPGAVARTRDAGRRRRPPDRPATSCGSRSCCSSSSACASSGPSTTATRSIRLRRGLGARFGAARPADGSR